MYKMLKIWLFTLLLLLPGVVGSADGIYPETLDNGNYVLVDGGMGIAQYADRSSVVVQNYAPPHYQIALDVIWVEFSDAYWRRRETYIGGPHKIIDKSTVHFRYHWDSKSVAYLTDNGWLDWNINRDYSHAEGDPFYPYTAEVAFVTAYNMRFYDDTLGYSPALQQYSRVIDESFYSTLGI